MNDCNDSLPKQGGWGGSLVEGFLLTLHHNTLVPRKLHHFVKCFVFLNHFENTTSKK